VQRIVTPEPTIEGAGVKLKRSIATRSLNYLDPFLLFDHFGSDNPDDYVAGFPMHPHRGIETVTYMLSGIVNHRDSIGHSGSISAGDVQWMTAGSGIMHEEMPQVHGGRLNGFQLWVNLPARLKMTRPRYQEYAAGKIPEITAEDGVKIRVIAGMLGDARGPVSEIALDPTYLDISIPADASFAHPIQQGHTAFAYVYEGEGIFAGTDRESGSAVTGPKLVVFGDGDSVDVRATQRGARFLLISGKPLHEPIARYGPFVMNTEEEIKEALLDLRQGTFVK
jgi:redox-sensitive bicupin YhaK (pirin superfamily)